MARNTLERITNGGQVIGAIPAVEQTEESQQAVDGVVSDIRAEGAQALLEPGFEALGQFRPALRISDAICCAMSRTASVCSTSLVNVTMRQTGSSVSRS